MAPWCAGASTYWLVGVLGCWLIGWISCLPWYLDAGGSLFSATHVNVRNCHHIWLPDTPGMQIPRPTVFSATRTKMSSCHQIWHPGTTGVQIPRVTLFRLPAQKCAAISKSGFQGALVSRFLETSFFDDLLTRAQQSPNLGSKEPSYPDYWGHPFFSYSLQRAQESPNLAPLFQLPAQKCTQGSRTVKL